MQILHDSPIPIHGDVPILQQSWLNGSLSNMKYGVRGPESLCLPLLSSLVAPSSSADRAI